MKKYIFALFTIINIIACTSDDENTSTTDAQTTVFLGEIDWLKTFGGTQEDNARDITNTTDGGTVIIGYTKSTDGDISDQTTEQNDYWITRLDANGSVVWSKTYGGGADDRGEAITATNDGGFVATGYSRSNDEDVTVNNGFYDQWIVKIDANGTIQWETSLGFSGSDQALEIIQTSDGGYFVTGFLDVSASGGQGNAGRLSNTGKFGNPEHGVGEFWCHKLNANGIVVWSRYFGGSSNDRSYAAVETNNQNFVVIGSSESADFDITNSKGSYDFWIVKLASNGDMIWQKSYGGSGIEIAYDIAKTDDGNYIVVGDTRSVDGDISNAKGAADFWVIKISDTDGALMWERTFGGTDFESARAITALQSGDYAIVGSAKSDNIDVDANYGQNDFWVIKISEEGNLLWEQNFGGSQLDIAYGIVETSDQKLVVIGDTQSNDGDISENKGVKDALLIQIK